MPGKMENCSVLGDRVVSRTEVWSLNRCRASTVLYAKLQICLCLNFQQHDRPLDWNSGKNAAFYSPLSRCLSGSVSVFPHPTLQFLHRPNGDEGPHFSQWILSPPLVAGLRASYTAHIPPPRANLCVALGRPSPSNFLMYVPCERFGLSLLKNTRTA